MPNLTNTVIDKLLIPTQGCVLYWDDKLKGFGLRVNASGSKQYVVQYRNKSNQSKRHKIGQHGVLTPIQARKMAQQLLADVARGGDPETERRNRIDAETIKDLCEQYMEKHARLNKKPSSVKADEWMIRKVILPKLGNRKIADITRQDISQLHYAMRATPYNANRMLQILSKMFNLAEKWGLRADHTNPVYHVDKYPEKKRERYLSLDEVSRLNAVLADGEHNRIESAHVVAAFRLLIFTGCRLGEIQTLQWEFVDFNNRCLRLPDSKTGAKVVQLNAPALDVLVKLERQSSNPYVIIGTVAGQHVTDMQKPWRRIRKAAGLEDVRIHDLRHTFASVAVGMGENLPMIGKLLGHTQIATTQRYAHLADDPQKAAAERIGAAIAAMMDNRTAQVLPFPAA